MDSVVVVIVVVVVVVFVVDVVDNVGSQGDGAHCKVEEGERAGRFCDCQSWNNELRKVG